MMLLSGLDILVRVAYTKQDANHQSFFIDTLSLTYTNLQRPNLSFLLIRDFDFYHKKNSSLPL